MTDRLIPVLAVLLAGCAIVYPQAKRPPTGAPDTNERMWVEAHEYQTSHVVREKVGESTHKDNEGHTIGTTDTYANRTVTENHVAWQAMQGTTPVDDEDFFRIVGDSNALETTRSHRDSAVGVNRVGRTMMLVGGVAMIAALFVPNDSAQAITFSGGLLVGGLGWYLAVTGAGRMDEHAVPVTRAIGDAEQHNIKRGLGVALSGRF